jgi:hypothetical protein
MQLQTTFSNEFNSRFTGAASPPTLPASAAHTALLSFRNEIPKPFLPMGCIIPPSITLNLNPGSLATRGTAMAEPKLAALARVETAPVVHDDARAREAAILAIAAP